jgi:hypothetical protein
LNFVKAVSTRTAKKTPTQKWVGVLFCPSPAGDADIRRVPTPDARRGTEIKENPQKMFGLLRVLDLFGCFADYLKPIAFFGDHSESASVVPFDVNRAKSVNVGYETFVSPLQPCVRVA